jgi:hypothetical protein
MTNQPFNNTNTDQQTRLQVLKDTYLTRARADADLAASGRFKTQNATVVTSIPTYPRQPTASPWASADPNIEPPLGFSVDELPELGGASAPAVETPTPERGGSGSALTVDPPQPLRRRRL